MIHVRNLSKHFRISTHSSGMAGTLRSLISRQYRTVKAVDNISFDINAGELVGYLGPNGAGKSTTLKMLTGLLVPTTGDISVNGHLPWKTRKRYVARIGAVFGQRTTLWWDLPVIDSLSLLQHIYRIPADTYQRNLAKFTKVLELSPFLDTPVRSLSLGQRMRADIAAALLHDPDILFLDEPTIGLDVVAKERIREFILQVNAERKTTVLLTTHDLTDVERLCDRVMIIDQGKLLFDGQLSQLRARFGGKRELVVDFAERYDSASVVGADLVSLENQRATYQFSRGETTASELIQRISSQYRIRDLEVREPDIETTIRRIYEERLLATE